MPIITYREVVISIEPSAWVVRCGRCRGTGSRDRDGRDPKCSVCGGAGRVVLHRRPGELIRCAFCDGDGCRDRDGRDPVCPVCLGVGGVFCELPAVDCAKCNGTGSRDRDRREPICDACRGTGAVPVSGLKAY